MVKDYKTMKWVETLSTDSDEDDRLTAYECKVCHGVSLVRCADEGKLTCRLCDESAPLPERFRMALGTLGQLCMQRVVHWGQNAITYSFGSFNVTVRDPDYIDTLGLDLVDLVEVRFDYEGETVLAHKDGFLVDTGEDEEDRLFDDGLDAGDDEFTPGILAHEFVYRFRYDMAETFQLCWRRIWDD